ncbi:Zinc finger BED domain-containing protein RICESLEEPER 2 [Bienertia sinuspersici]
MTNHAESCFCNLANKDKDKGKEMRSKLYFEQLNDSGELKCGIAKLKDVREAFIYMIIVDELPFKHFEKLGSKYLMQISCPNFHIPSQEAIRKVVKAFLEYWGIKDKLFTIIVDNASSNDVAFANLSKMVRRTGCVIHEKNIHVRCIAHIINLIVWDGIKGNGVCIDKARNAVKYVKNSL